MEIGVRGCRCGERTSQNGVGNITEAQKLIVPFSHLMVPSQFGVMSAGLFSPTQVNGYFSGVNGERTYLAEAAGRYWWN